MKRISGPDVAALPEDLRGTPVGITDSRVLLLPGGFDQLPVG